MSVCSGDEYVSATPDSTPPRSVQSRMFQYFTPENSPGRSRVSRFVPDRFPTPSPSPESVADKRSGISRAPGAPLKAAPSSGAASGPAARRKLPFHPRRRQSGRKKVDFKNALFKVLRKINPAGTISSKAMNVLNDMICDLMERLATEAQSIREMNNKRTLNMRDIQTAARLMLPGQLSTHAFYEAHRAVRQLIVAQDDARRN